MNWHCSPLMTKKLWGLFDQGEKSGEYLVSVINDVLDMSRIESGKMTLAHQQFDLPGYWKT